MLYRILKLDLLKTLYREYSVEIRKLSEKKGATEAAGNKAAAYGKILRKRNETKAEYDRLKPEVLDWLRTTYSNPKYKEKLACYCKYYGNISYDNFQETIDSLYPPSCIADDTDEGKKIPAYKAGNLKGTLHTSCIRQIEQE